MKYLTNNLPIWNIIAKEKKINIAHVIPIYSIIHITYMLYNQW